jgi:prolyl-tRNA synthetase
VEQVTAFLGVPPQALVKTLIYVADGKPVAVLVRGDHDANPLKVKALLVAADAELASDEVVTEVTKAPPGFAGPVGLGLPLLVDRAVVALSNFFAGANEADAHYMGANLGRDFQATQVADLRLAQAGDGCPRCGCGRYESFRGIEVGHVFFLGTKYSKAMHANYVDTQGQEHPISMGCYGIGITRTMAAAIEQGHDSDGMNWPMSLAPYHALVLPLQMRDPHVVATAEAIYRDLAQAGVEVVLDDRDERPGIKFKDADLLGIPLRVTVGQKTLAQGNVEVKRRGRNEVQLVPPTEAAALIRGLIQAELSSQ